MFASPSGQDGQQCPGSTLGLAHAVVGQRCRMLRHVTFPVVSMFGIWDEQELKISN